MEAQLRYAQATDALSGLRRSLAVTTELLRYKKSEVRGQGANTRARGLLSNAGDRTHVYVARYRCARKAYFNLKGAGDWELVLKELTDPDVRAMSAHQNEASLDARTGPREGHRLVSWIYMAPGAADDSAELNEGTHTSLKAIQCL